MTGGRKIAIAVAAVVALLAAGGVLGYQQLAKAPRPTLVYPSGQSLESVRGNCQQGNELTGCHVEGGPRSFMTIRATGEARANVMSMFDTLLAHGWTVNDAGGTAYDYAEGGAPEDIQPLYCRGGRGCVGLFRYVDQGYVLAWFT